MDDRKGQINTIVYQLEDILKERSQFKIDEIELKDSLLHSYKQTDLLNLMDEPDIISILTNLTTIGYYLIRVVEKYKKEFDLGMSDTIKLITHTKYSKMSTGEGLASVTVISSGFDGVLLRVELDLNALKFSHKTIDESFINSEVFKKIKVMQKLKQADFSNACLNDVYTYLKKTRPTKFAL